jgi:hypothetical protein
MTASTHRGGAIRNPEPKPHGCLRMRGCGQVDGDSSRSSNRDVSILSQPGPDDRYPPRPYRSESGTVYIDVDRLHGGLRRRPETTGVADYENVCEG